jgi:hypothetical protein
MIPGNPNSSLTEYAKAVESLKGMCIYPHLVIESQDSYSEIHDRFMAKAEAIFCKDEPKELYGPYPSYRV